MDLVIPDTVISSLEEGAVDPWTKPQTTSIGYTDFKKRAHRQGSTSTVPFCRLRSRGTRSSPLASASTSRRSRRKKYKVHVRVFLSRYRGYARLPGLHGSRLRKEALYVRVGDKTMADVSRMNTAEAYTFFDDAGT